MSTKILIPLFFVTCFTASAREIEGVKFADQITVSGHELVLNGVGLRVKRKFGMNFKVYVAGLYVPTKSDQAAEIISSLQTKSLRLVFLRSLDKDTLREAWAESYAKNCGSDCSTTQAQLKAFNELMADVKDKNELRLDFLPSEVVVEMNGKKEHKSGKVEGEAFRKNLLAVFIGAQPPTEDLRKGLLGL